MAKERISLTLDQDLVARIDRKLAREGLENRSRGIEQLLRDSLKQEAVTTAVVLAGGDDPTCLTPIDGKPAILHILDLLSGNGIEQVYILADDDSTVDEAVNGHDLAPELRHEEEPQGTAGCLRSVKGEVGETFLVVNGDVVCDVDLEDMAAAHEDTGGLATIALTTARDSSNYGVIRMKRNKVVGFEEKPEESSSHLVNAGIYLLEPELLERIPGEEEEPVVDIEAVFETLAEEGSLNGYVYDGEWREVG